MSSYQDIYNQYLAESNTYAVSFGLDPNTAHK